MARLKHILHYILSRPSLFLFVFLAVFTVDRHKRHEFKGDPQNGPIFSDVLEYYRFLPDLFLNDPEVSAPLINVNKRTLGMAVLYSPAFVTGHLLAKHNGEDLTGYSPSYQWTLRWGSIIYSLLGLWLCRKNLRRFFSEWVTFVSLICIWFGTNLFYYTYSWGEMPHSYLFFLYSFFIWATLKFITDKKSTGLVWMGITGGMIVLIRPTGAIVCLFPLLYGINSVHQLKERLILFISKPLYLFAAFLLFLIPILSQMIFWKIYKGAFTPYTYGEERFFFNDPQIINFIFSYRKGWLVYTPIMIFSLFGMFTTFKNLKSFSIFLPVHFILNVYILSSWWAWSFDGSFGCRVLVESYAFLIFSFASFIAWVFNAGYKIVFLKPVVVTCLIGLMYLLIEVNMIQNWQYRAGIIHWSGMNKGTYWFAFLRTTFSEEEMIYLNSQFTPPDHQKMLKGDRDF